MIIKEFYKTRSDGVDLYLIKSDSDYMILQSDTNNLYSEAIDVEMNDYTYVETDIKIKREDFNEITK